MGLDMYAFTTKEPLTEKVDFREPADATELHYWRKHPNLHGWMQALYVEKGGLNDEFNLSAVVLDSGDLDRLEAAVRGGELPETDGCFFGLSDGKEAADDLAFIAKARREIGLGKTVLYVAWW